jgi:hypothetical protein
VGSAWQPRMAWRRTARRLRLDRDEAQQGQAAFDAVLIAAGCSQLSVSKYRLGVGSSWQRIRTKPHSNRCAAAAANCRDLGKSLDVLRAPATAPSDWRSRLRPRRVPASYEAATDDRREAVGAAGHRTRADHSDRSGVPHDRAVLRTARRRCGWRGARPHSDPAWNGGAAAPPPRRRTQRCCGSRCRRGAPLGEPVTDSASRTLRSKHPLALGELVTMAPDGPSGTDENGTRRPVDVGSACCCEPARPQTVSSISGPPRSRRGGRSLQASPPEE